MDKSKIKVCVGLSGGVDSSVAAYLLKQEGYCVGNIDSIIVAQKPKVGPYIPQMRQTIADILGTDVSCVSVKATTTEHLGFEGRQEGISTHAVVLLNSIQ